MQGRYQKQKAMITNSNKPIKCVSKDFTSNPFFLIQYNGSQKRFLAFFQNKEKIKQFLTLFIDQSVDDVQVKIYDVEDINNPKEHEGSVTKVKLKAAIKQYEEVVFHNGRHDFMIRQPETDDYIVFDEHGMIFIYTQDDYTTILENFGLSFQPNKKLIESFNHWHYSSQNHGMNLQSFIASLELK